MSIYRLRKVRETNIQTIRKYFTMENKNHIQSSAHIRTMLLLHSAVYTLNTTCRKSAEVWVSALPSVNCVLSLQTHVTSFQAVGQLHLIDSLTLQSIAIVLGYPPELEGKIKILHTSIIDG